MYKDLLNDDIVNTENNGVGVFCGLTLALTKVQSMVVVSSRWMSLEKQSA